MNIEEFRKLQEYKKLEIPQAKIDKLLGLSKISKNLDEQHTRYLKKSCNKIKVLIRYFTKEELLTGITYYINNNDCSVTTLCAYLISKYGETRCKVPMGGNYYYYKKLSKEITNGE